MKNSDIFSKKILFDIKKFVKKYQETFIPKSFEKFDIF